MSDFDYYEVEYLEAAEKEISRFVRKKKFRKLPGQLSDFEEQLRTGHFPGTLIFKGTEQKPYDVYKVRLPNEDTNQGKSNGYRIFYVVVHIEKRVVLLAIYYKKENDTLSDEYIYGLIDGLAQSHLPDNEDA